MENAEKEEPIG
jgi:hypothetical protein